MPDADVTVVRIRVLKEGRRTMHGYRALGTGFLFACCVCFVSRAVSGQGAEPAQFIRGDANADGEKDIGDVVYMLRCSFLGGSCPTCADAADVNDDGARDIGDPIFLLNYLFLAGADLPAPNAACGVDEMADELDCALYPRCLVSSNPEAIATSRGDLVITPVEHASLVLEWDGKVIYSDPVGGAGKFAGLPAPDIIVITHSHGDHMDRGTLLAIAKPGTVLVDPTAVSQSLKSSGGIGGISEMVLANGQSTNLYGVGIDAIPMYNSYHPKGQGNGYVLNLDGTRVYIAGVTEDIIEMRNLQNISLAFVCMNLPYTMTPAKAASAVLQFKPRFVYPYHYRDQDGTADPNAQAFKTAVEAGSQAIEVRLRDWYP
jgi:L-ascorbate metabolism protein UlaG (beta-lactamase superfamily)